MLQYDSHMGVLVQIRDVPEDVHRKLKSRAAASGQSLTEYLREMLVRSTDRPTAAELTAQIEAREPIKLDEPSEVTIRRLRDALD